MIRSPLRYAGGKTRALKHILPKSSFYVQQRQSPTTELDYFPTPKWATRALCEKLDMDDQMTAADPCCGSGEMVEALNEYFRFVFGSDIHDYNGNKIGDFLDCSQLTTYMDWIIMNPPFNQAQQFIERALKLSPYKGTAALVRLAFLESARRHKLFTEHPFSRVIVFSERVNFWKGEVSRKTSSAVPHCWIVWDKSPDKNRVEWFEPGTRKRLERVGDYKDD